MPRKTERAKSGTEAGAIRAEEGFWIAVLPFKSSTGNADLRALAEGLTEEIITGLSHFSYLKVIARSSTIQYKGKEIDLDEIGQKLGIPAESLEPYGHDKAKVSADFIKSLSSKSERRTKN